MLEDEETPRSTIYEDETSVVLEMSSPGVNKVKSKDDAKSRPVNSLNKSGTSTPRDATSTVSKKGGSSGDLTPRNDMSAMSRRSGSSDDTIQIGASSVASSRLSDFDSSPVRGPKPPSTRPRSKAGTRGVGKFGGPWPFKEKSTEAKSDSDIEDEALQHMSLRELAQSKQCKPLPLSSRSGKYTPYRGGPSRGTSISSMSSVGSTSLRSMDSSQIDMVGCSAGQVQTLSNMPMDLKTLPSPPKALKAEIFHAEEYIEIDERSRKVRCAWIH